MSAIVLDGHLKSALAVVRSLGKKNIPVFVGGERKSAMALHSTYASGSFVYPSPHNDPEGFIEALKSEAIRIGGKPLIYAMSDATFCLIHAHRDVLVPHATFVFPEEKSIELAFNKAATYSLARVSGVPVISTYAPDRDEELKQIEEKFVYPVVVKPRRSIVWKEGKGVSGTAVFVQNQDALWREYTLQKERYGETPLIQDMVQGEEYGVEALVHEGKPYALFSHRRIRSLSPRGGASVVKESLLRGGIRDTLVRDAKTLMAKLNWEGPIMVEFKVDAVSGQAFLMEINGRFWGSLPLSIASGVDMPYVYYRALKNNDIPETTVEATKEAVTVHTMGDVAHLLRVFFSIDPMRKALYPGRVKTLAGFFRGLGYTNDVWSLRDPKPAIMEIIDLITRIWR